ncbi:sulfate ABC transporter substrate-binding protein [Tumebacillus algifaecis]|uniref:Sulfate ABC transporter substrate-binding protein n=1 Tax=Tumebacillus algifaecis TaxID=1214604 RepID=A0A223D292_9BACL|nr:sulfate ABC transporter substrate-binding protein [Tumebacillus algifaecis]ASS75507.1 sulfate ABC transporter substrate-binding protein [Tumebacillus algifaecis]
MAAKNFWVSALVAVSLAILPACSEKTDQAELTLTLGAYTVPKEAFGKIIPKFQEAWKAKTGQHVLFQESYEASGTQARAIVGGFEADLAALSLEADIDAISQAGLITHDWKAKQHGGMVTNSVVALGVRDGNPKAIKDWEDLAGRGVSVLYPNPKTSGGAQWDINAIYGAGLKKSEETGAKNPAFAKDLLRRIHANVKSLDKSGRASMTTFESGTGDVVVTYENELLARVKEGAKYTIVVPTHTIKIENPVAIIDKNVDKHGTREVAEAFVSFLYTKEAQTIFAESGFRPVDPDVAQSFSNQYQTPPGLFEIAYLGGWSKVRHDLYGEGALWDQILAGN